MSELHKIRGADEATLRAILGRLDMVAGRMAIARETAAGFQPCGTADTMKRELSAARGELEAARATLAHALEAQPWCDGCGIGATGVTARISTTPGGSIKCESVPCCKCLPQEEGFA